MPLHNAREFSGQPFSAMNKCFFPIGASSPSVKNIYECFYAKHTNVSLTEMPELSFAVCILEGAL